MSLTPPVTGNEDLDSFLFNVALNGLGVGGGNGTLNYNNGILYDSENNIVGFKYQYIHIRYADDNTGTNISTSSVNRVFYGIYNSSSTNPNNNPADYTWFETEGFENTHKLWYSVIGGRQIKFQVSILQPTNVWVAHVAQVIDLDIISLGLANLQNQNTDVSELLNILENSITSSQLYSALAERIDLIDGLDTLEGSVNFRIKSAKDNIDTNLAGVENNIGTINSVIETIQSDINDLVGTPDYDSEEIYQPGNIVKYDGSIYRALLETTGDLPTDDTYWQLIGQYDSIAGAVAAQAIAINDLETSVSNNSGDITAVSNAVDTLLSTISTNQTELIALVETEATTRVDSDSALAEVINTVVSTFDNNIADTNALILSESSTRASAVEAVANQVDTVYSNLNTGLTNLDALVQTEITTLTAENEVLASSVTNFSASLESNISSTNALITDESIARVTDVESLTSSINSLSVGFNETIDGKVAQSNAFIESEVLARSSADEVIAYTVDVLSSSLTNELDTRVNELNASIVSESSARITADEAVASTFNSLTSSLTQYTDFNLSNLNSLIVEEANTKTTELESLASTVTTLSSNLENNLNSLGAAIRTETETRVGVEGSLATSINTLQAESGTNALAIQTESTTRATETGDLFGKYSVKIDNNGYVSGFGLLSTANNGTPFSDFIVRADKFAIASPAGPSITPSVPFIVYTTSQNITTPSGETITVDPGVYMRNANIEYVTADKITANAITADKIKANAVTAEKIQANAINADKITANAVTAGKIQSGSVSTQITTAFGGSGSYIKATPSLYRVQTDYQTPNIEIVAPPEFPNRASKVKIELVSQGFMQRRRADGDIMYTGVFNTLMYLVPATNTSWDVYSPSGFLELEVQSIQVPTYFSNVPGEPTSDNYEQQLCSNITADLTPGFYFVAVVNRFLGYKSDGTQVYFDTAYGSYNNTAYFVPRNKILITEFRV